MNDNTTTSDVDIYPTCADLLTMRAQGWTFLPREVEPGITEYYSAQGTTYKQARAWAQYFEARNGYAHG